MLRYLHRCHEVHYITLDHPKEPEGLARSSEYCTKAYAVEHHIPARGSGPFVWQALSNLIDPLPLSIARYRSPGMKRQIAGLLKGEGFDRLVCDFLVAAPNIPSIDRALLFQHNVETTIWDRHVETASDPVRKAYFRLERNRMARYEAKICRAAAHVAAVSRQDADVFRNTFGVKGVSEVPTGVDVNAFTPRNGSTSSKVADLVFVGSMDWLPNIDGCNYFVNEILPIIRQSKPECSVAIVGRSPASGILEMSKRDPKIIISGTVPDIKPYFWGSSVSIVPLRIGSGTRLKIYEAMAAKTPIVSTSIGAEGLPVTSGKNIFLADTPTAFADNCLKLLNSETLRKSMADTAWQMVSADFSWEHASRRFESILEKEVPSLR